MRDAKRRDTRQTRANPNQTGQLPTPHRTHNPSEDGTSIVGVPASLRPQTSPFCSHSAPPTPPQETHCPRRRENRPPRTRTVEKRYCSSATSSTVKTPKLTPSPIMTKYPVHIFSGWLGSLGSPKNDSLQRYCANPPSLRQGVTFTGQPVSPMATREGAEARPRWGETATGGHRHARRLHPRGRRHDGQRMPPRRLLHC